MPDSRFRFLILRIVGAVMLLAVVVKLFDLQIVNGDTYLKRASSRLTTSVVNKAARGDIMDRYGNVLVTNKTGYSVVLQKTTGGDEELNNIISKVVEILYTTGNKAIDNLPVSAEAPYEFVFEDENGDGRSDDEMAEWFAGNKYTGKYLYEGMTADQVMAAYAEIFGVEHDVNLAHTRCMIGIRYEADLKEISTINPVTIAEDVNVDAVTQIKELQDSLPGVSVTEDYVRTYTRPGFATHILGRVGKISAEEYAANSDKGYGMNDIIGKQGVERWAESYLRGVDGTTGTTTKIDGDEVELGENIDPIPGNYIMLTIDSDLQETVEASLEKTIKSIGNDCNAGAAVVLDVNTGDTLAMASYPTYDMSRFYEDYQSLVENKSNPMINRAVCGLYSPGSTFKPLTAIAGIQTGNLGLWEQIEDTGVYTFYEDYQPTCWIWSESHTTHGWQDVSLALENSCNVFFYELGRRLGIDTLDEYAKKFGLGEYTNIELPEEASGHMASPEYKAQVVSNAVDREWFGGDTLQAAIGQSYSLFTPVQIANYCATIANGGTRYKVNLISSIRSSVDGSLVEKFEPQIEEQTDISPEALAKVHEGMKKVVDEGSASSIFEGYPIQVGGKTGTAQLGTGSNNAIFMAFAPYDDPQIAVAVVLEHGVRGANAGQVARDIFDKYFFDNTSADAAGQAAEPAANPSAEFGLR
ncbi:MAG: penicillin-binding transpeptidase domain-containing protein [Candidatus Ornithomonoglobus sp.]